MRLSSYNKLVAHKDGTLLYNLVSGALVLLNKNQLQEYLKIQSGDLTNLNLLKKLTNLGFYVEDIDERVIMRKKYEEIVNDCQNKNLTIVVTDRCNLGCHYCYEEKTQWLKMSLETQEQIKKFVYRFVTETPTKNLGIGWFGGEPTMNIQAVENLSRYFIKVCEEKGINLHQNMVTNGTTFSSSMADLIVKDLKIRNLQITVDGFKEDHDQSRPYLNSLKLEEMSDVQIEQRKKLDKNFSLTILNQPEPKPLVKSSYDSIMKNIELLLERGAVINLRMNVNSDSIKRIEVLLNELHEKNYFKRNKNNGILYAYAHPIFSNGSCGGSSFKTMTVEEFSHEVQRIRKWYKEHDIEFFDHHNEMKFTGQTCTANKRWEYVINPDGSLTKCWHHAADATKAIGHVSQDFPFIDFKQIKGNKFHQFNPFEDQECFNCEVLPICMGGCKANNQVDQNSNGYSEGCITTRYALQEEVASLYELRKESANK